MLKRLLFGTTIVQSFVADFALFVVRVFTGLAMALAHGYGKIPPSEKFVAGVEQLGFPAASAFAWAASVSEFGGGLLLALGLLTRPAAFFVACTMTVAAFMRHATDPFDVQERALLYLALAALFAVFGGGRFAVDRWLRK